MEIVNKISSIPRIEYLHIKNYRVLQDIELSKISPMTVLLGPNGSGKSTLFDVFAFLSECFTVGLRKAWDKRGRFKELRSRGTSGPLVFELKYREKSKMPIITYHLEIDEDNKGPFIKKEFLQWRRGSGGRGQPFKFLDFSMGKGSVIEGDTPDETGSRIPEELDSTEMLAVNTLGQLSKHPRVSALRRFITSWYLSYLTADNTRGIPEAGPQERLSSLGDNLPNVIQYLKEQHSDRLIEILNTLKMRVPHLEKVDSELLADGRLLLRIKDGPFNEPILSKFTSDGTLKMLAYLSMLYDPSPPQLIGIEEPENQLHPRLLSGLAEECQKASAFTQLMITTHSPYFINELKPEQVWILYRDKKGYSKAHRISDIPSIKGFIDNGGKLGYLWMEGFFNMGDPLSNQGMPLFDWKNQE